MSRVAAVDIGTNSVRLLVADVDGTGRDAKLAHRSTGACASPASARASTRTARARARGDRAHGRRAARVPRRARRARRRARPRHGHERGARRDRTATTSSPPRATRSASTPELLSGEEEAALSFLGATADLDAPAPYLVVDIGGGSTEFVLGTDAARRAHLARHRVRAHHRAVPALRPARARGARRTRSRSCATSSPTSRASSPVSPRRATLVGLAGHRSPPSPRSSSGLPEYDPERIHHFHLTRAAAEDVFRTLATESAERARAQPRARAGSRRRDRRRRDRARQHPARARLRRGARVGGRHPRRPRAHRAAGA